MNAIISTALSKLHGGIKASRVAQALARDVIRKSVLTTPPFDPFIIAKNLKLTITYAEIAAEAVLKDFDSDNPQIILAGSSVDYLGLGIRRRINFTVAHEIGHFAIRKAVSGFVPMSAFASEHEDEERLCNEFASELLMPWRCISQSLGSHELSPRSILKIADEYDVSLTALLTRAAKLWFPHFRAILWRRSKFGIRPHWAFPLNCTRAILCDTGNTSVERAFQSEQEEIGTSDLLINGERFRWKCISFKTGVHPDTVLTILYRSSLAARKLLPSARSKPNTVINVDTLNALAVQQVLPFPEKRTMHAARRRRDRKRT